MKSSFVEARSRSDFLHLPMGYLVSESPLRLLDCLMVSIFLQRVSKAIVSGLCETGGRYPDLVHLWVLVLTLWWGRCVALVFTH